MSTFQPVDLSTLSTCQPVDCQPCRPANPVDPVDLSTLSTMSTCQPCRPVNMSTLSTCQPCRPVNLSTCQPCQPLDLSSMSTCQLCQPVHPVDPVNLSCQNFKIVRSGKCMIVLIMFGLLLTVCMPYSYIKMYAIFIFIYNNVRRINILLVNQ